MAQFTAPKQIKAQMVMKAEATAGTDVLGGTYVAADIIPTINDAIRFSQDPNEIENTMTAGLLGRAASILGPLTARIDFDMWMRGKFDGSSAYDDAPEVVPEWDRPFRACGLSRNFTVPGGPSAILDYQPSETEETFTVYLVQDVPGGAALSIQMVGCLATCTMQTVAGRGLRASFTIMGALQERADITYVQPLLVLTPAYPTTRSAAFQIGSTNYAPRIANLGFAFGNTVSHIPSINAVGGVAGTKIFDRNPRLQIDPEADREATSGWWTRLSTGGPLDDCTFQVGTVQGNRIKFKFAANGTSAQLQLVQQAFAFRDGLAVLPSVLLPTISAAGDDWRITVD